MDKEIIFKKYDKRGSDYHYKQINFLKPGMYNAYVHARYLKQIKILLQKMTDSALDKNKTFKVLDMGCGDGVLLFLLKKHIKKYQFDIYGTDLSEIAVQTAKEKLPTGHFFVGSVYETVFDDHFFDIVISSDVIEHVNFPGKMLNEIKRISQNDTIIVIGTPVRYTEMPLDKMHVKEFFPGEFKNLLSEYFNNVNIVVSHRLYNFLYYKQLFKLFGLSISLNRYKYYLYSLFAKNPFLKNFVDKEHYTYMFAIMTK
jgi:ubiquinone/menaquinone biosynthesis C-methylase UbiE